MAPVLEGTIQESLGPDVFCVGSLLVRSEYKARDLIGPRVGRGSPSTGGRQMGPRRPGVGHECRVENRDDPETQTLRKVHSKGGPRHRLRSRSGRVGSVDDGLESGSSLDH